MKYHSVSKKLLAALTAAVCLVSATSCSGGNDGKKETTTTTKAEANSTTSASTDKSEVVTIVTGYSTSADDPRGVVLQKFKETVEAETKGNVLVEIHPGGELGSDGDLIKGLIDGTVGMTVSSAGNYATYATKLGVSALPFLFSDFESAWKFIDSDTMQSLNVDLEPFNMHVLAYFDNGFRCVTTTNKPINSVADMEGLIIRVPPNQTLKETMNSLKAKPMEFDFAKLKDALKNGEFDAQENPIPVIYNNKLYEVQKYLSITNHSYDAMPLAIRKDLWDSLSPEYQEIITKAAKTAEAEDRNLIKKQTEDFVSKLEAEGMTIIHPDLAPFKEATAGVIDVFADVYGDELVKTIKSL